MSKQWIKNGKRLIDENGKRILCDDCPCGCPAEVEVTIAGLNNNGLCLQCISTGPFSSRVVGTNVDGTYTVPFDSVLGTLGCRLVLISTSLGATTTADDYDGISDVCFGKAPSTVTDYIRIQVDLEKISGVWKVKQVFAQMRSPNITGGAGVYSSGSGIWDMGETINAGGTCGIFTLIAGGAGTAEVNFP